MTNLITIARQCTRCGADISHLDPEEYSLCLSCNEILCNAYLIQEGLEECVGADNRYVYPAHTGKSREQQLQEARAALHTFALSKSPDLQIQMLERRFGYFPKTFRAGGQVHEVEYVSRCWTKVDRHPRLYFQVHTPAGDMVLYQDVHSNTWHKEN